MNVIANMKEKKIIIARENLLDVELNMSDMVKINSLYEVMCMREYLEDIYPNWPEKKLEFVSERTCEIFDDAQHGDEESLAIAKAVKEWSENNA